MIRFRPLLAALSAESVQFVIVGGIAAILHGSARVTYDLDIVYNRSPENLQRLVAALGPFNPYPRGAPAGLPFTFDFLTLKHGLNFTFDTTAGPIDLLGELSGIGSFPAVQQSAVATDMFGETYRFLDLDALIVSKKAAGRKKDVEAVAELEMIRDERRSSS
ncbi:MAG TPA: hypothetical protein VEK57_25975 [Thermoanaerobaculia bacterium]|nr:hypothetical protein [Thermoanaerobaculia bacterium]